jgi:hypothetical protein
MAAEETANRGNITQNYNAAQTGMNMDNTIGQIKKGTLTYALNANVENFDSNSVNYQNEEGNVLCSDEDNVFFPNDFIVIGNYFINEQNKHIFFLVNPTDNKSEIGYMINNDCVYRTLVSSTQNDCLNFNINYPIHKAVHRITNCSTEIYWTDGLNPRRYIDIDNIPWQSTIINCIDVDIIPLMLDCNKIKMQPNFDIPQIAITNVITGGELTAGTYQFAIQYCNDDGIGYTSYYSVTNPVPIANTLIISPDFNYPVNKSILIDITNIDTQDYYQYYNVAVIKTVNGITSVELVGTYLIDSDNNQITYTGQNQTQINLTIEDIFEKFPIYEIAQDVTTVQDILIWDQLTSIDRINFQSVASQITLKWESYKITAPGSYADSETAASLRGYLRDEVYAFEIVFLLKNGKQTDGFHIPGRALIPGVDDVQIPMSNNDFIGEPEPGQTYAYQWKIYNTAAVDSGTPTGPTINGYNPYKSGRFAYWQSSDEYPCDVAMWGSLAGTKIRHHKFPDILVSPAFESATPVVVGSTYNVSIQGPQALYPLGVRVDIDQIKTLLTSAGLIDEIQGFKIVRGNRSTNKSIVGKGIVRNIGKYTREGTTFMFPNYPYNDLRVDPFLLKNNNAYINECYSWDVEMATAGGTVQYTNCSDGNATVYTFITPTTHTLYSTTKPFILTGTLGPSGITYVNTNAYQTYTIIVNAVGQTTTIRIYANAIIYYDIPVTYGTPLTTVSYTGLLGRPIWVSGSTDFSLFINDQMTPGGTNDSLINTPLNAYNDPNFSRARFVFNSPETSFGQPTLGSVLKMENVIFGAGKGHFVEVKNNAQYKLLTSTVQQSALDSSFTIANSTGTFDANAMFTTYQAYLQIYINGISRSNFAYSFNSIASYDYSDVINNGLGVKQRMLATYQYLTPGVQAVNDIYDINNYQRESSVFLRTDTAPSGLLPLPLPFPSDSPSVYNPSTSPPSSKIPDTSRFIPSELANCSQPEKEQAFKTVTYYASLKNIFLNQWGELYTYQTIDTGFQVEDISTTSGISVLFGGDTFISKFAFKTKLPFFLDNRVGAPDDSAINFDEIGNVAYPRFWHSARSVLSNYQTANGRTLDNIISIKAHNFDCAYLPVAGFPTTTSPVTTAVPNVTPSFTNAAATGKMYLFAYGIPYYYCESSINVDLRQAINNREGDFYPRVSSSIPDSWVQQTNVPIALDNTYYYNASYSKQNTENFFSHIPQGWTGICQTNYPFRAIYSDQQVSDPTNRINNWLTYRAVSYFDFPQNYGDLTALDGIQNKAILARFENKSLLYNTMLTINTSNPQAAYLGNSSLFRSAPPVDFAETDLGYVGSQNKMLLKIPQGQLTADAKRGQIFLISENQAVDITAFGSGVNRFMTDHLAFEILRFFPEADTDNNFTKVGLHAVYDSKYDRIIISKLDYIPQPEWISTMTYNTVTKEYYVDGEVVQLLDPVYFCNKSWTLSFNLNTKSWISFHSYIPNYYIAENNFFYSGLNQGCDLDFVAAIEAGENCALLGTATRTLSCNLAGTATTL